jgi:ABC-type multidrug transport system fused ATPase/permease subunit
LIGYALSELPRSQAGYGRIRSLIDEPLAADPAGEIGRDESGVVIDHVTVAHDDAVVVHDVSFSAPRGTLTAIVGPTGCGKTTLLHAVAGLNGLASGRISRPGGSCLMVFQESFLMGASVEDNIAMGLPVDGSAIDSAVESAEAQFVDELPHGLATIVGERGVGLSGGQRQRIALARALVREPDVLLLDDVTSALDPSTEARILEKLRARAGGMTIIAVASRPSLVAQADQVVVMSQGRVLATGRHEDLMETVLEYRDLMNAYESERAGGGVDRP